MTVKKLYPVRNASIHFPLAREDESDQGGVSVPDCFNPLPSCEGRRCPDLRAWHCWKLQSTSLLRGKTRHARRYAARTGSFNPLPSCEGRHRRIYEGMSRNSFNPLPSCEGRHSTPTEITNPANRFNPLPSCEGRPSLHLHPFST